MTMSMMPFLNERSRVLWYTETGLFETFEQLSIDT